MISKEKKEFTKWWIWLLFLIVASGAIFVFLSYAGIFGKTVVERKVFENSYQYSAGKKQQIATYEAQLAELSSKLINSNLDENTRSNIEAQMSAIRIQLRIVQNQ